MSPALKHSGENPYGKNPKTFRKWKRQAEKEKANPMPDGEKFWAAYWQKDAIDEDWSKPLTTKSEAELLKERIDETLKDWPWTGVPQKLVTVSPYAFNYYNEVEPHYVVRNPFMLPEVPQESKLFTELFRARPVLESISKHLFQYHDTSWKFSATCQEAARTLAQVLGFWDVNGGFFGHCEDAQTTDGQHPDSRVSLVTIVAPVRRPEGMASYVEQIENIHSLCLSVYNFAEYLRHIQFHKVPFLTTRLLELLIPKMHKLENLGIYKCQLIHVGDTMKLLEIIQTDRHFGTEYQVSLDFFPNHHVGPKKEMGKYCVGNYGACWDNWFGPTDLAVWAMVKKIIPQARKQGIDFESPYSAFRKWLDKSPCWRVDEVLQAVSDPTYGVAEFVALVDCRNPDHHGDVRKFKSNMVTRPSGWGCLTQQVPCNTCNTEQLGIFYWFGYLRTVLDSDQNIIPGRALRCLGCAFSITLNKERDHYKQRKRNLVRAWLREDDGIWNNADLLKAITDIGDKGIIARAQQLDDSRNISIHNGELDPELEAVQEPISEKALKQKFSSHKRSPIVEDKRVDPKFMTAEKRLWHEIARPERRNEHGF